MNRSPKSAFRWIRHGVLKIVSRYPRLVARRPTLLANNSSFKRYKIGRFTYGVPRVLFAESGSSLAIGSFCSIAQNVTIFLGGNHRTDWITTYPFSEFFACCADISGHPCSKGDVVIGNDVWIGANATIMSGVRIADGAVVAACSVVTKDVAPYSIVAGNPARFIRARFSERHIQGLLSIRWWEWPLSKILANRALLMSPDLAGFIVQNAKSKCPVTSGAEGS